LLVVAGGKEMWFIELPPIQELLCEELHNAILGAVEAKFGTLPVDLSERVRAIQELDRLRSLICELAVSTDLDAFRAKLPS
jgi:hypothetical protein